jgi:hypothetical protein
LQGQCMREEFCDSMKWDSRDFMRLMSNMKE